ncbi:hypothetical protein R3P38DRAFT_3266433 [Favolaschia claudopus]|uniref:Uncharacterized protein n=1 Tax=Favolaschia claudopus TaxID=2862362 RepID=A0AAW0BWZ8_9AGAR
MGAVVDLAGAYYPEFVLGGLVRLAVPIILKHTTLDIPTLVANFFKRLFNIHPAVKLLDAHSANPLVTVQPPLHTIENVSLTEAKVIHPICTLFLPIQPETVCAAGSVPVQLSSATIHPICSLFSPIQLETVCAADSSPVQLSSNELPPICSLFSPLQLETVCAADASPVPLSSDEIESVSFDEPKKSLSLCSLILPIELETMCTTDTVPVQAPSNIIQDGLLQESTITSPTCSPISPIQLNTTCAMDPIPFSRVPRTFPTSAALPLQSASQPVFSTRVIDPPSATNFWQVGISYLLSPWVIVQLLGLGVFFALATKWGRGRRHQVTSLNGKTGTSHNVAGRPARIRTLQRRPSDAENWRIPRNDAMRNDPSAQFAITSSSTRLSRPRTKSEPGLLPSRVVHTSPVTAIPPSKIHGDAHTSTPSPLVVRSSKIPRPVHPLYIPPHRRNSLDSTSRRPLMDICNADVARDKENKSPQIQRKAEHKHKGRLSSQPPLTTPALQSEGKMQESGLQTGVPLDNTMSMRRHAGASTDGQPAVRRRRF